MMAENLDLDDPEFWLPLEFLSDDDILTDFKKNKSNLSSPVEFVISSTETESDQDEFFTELTRRLAHSTYFSDDVWKPNYTLPYDQTNKSLNLATSPQSTLCNVMGSIRGSPSCPSPPVPPPTNEAVIRENIAAKNVLYAAAEEIAKLRRFEEACFNNSVHFSAASEYPSPLSVPSKNYENKNIYSNESFSYQCLQANQCQQHQLRKQEKGFVPKLHRNGNTEGRTVGLSSSAWPTLQQSHKQHPSAGSGMRPVFIGNQVVKRQCSGTGVFLPRSVRTPTETQKKPGCSTLVLPERIVQALNTKFERIETHHLNQIGLGHDYDAAIKYRNNVVMAQAQQRLDISRSPSTNNEFRLPQEWTY